MAVEPVRGKISIDCLKKEVGCEIFTRKGEVNFDLKINQLQKIFREIASQNVQLKFVAMYVPKSELLTIFSKFDEISEIIADCISDGFISLNQHKRISKRLMHLLYRSDNLLSCDVLREDEMNRLPDMLTNIPELIQSINNLLANVTSSQLKSLSVPETAYSVQSSGSSISGVSAQVVKPPLPNISGDNAMLLPLSLIWPPLLGFHNSMCSARHCPILPASMPALTLVKR
jgi:hypothetical protein